MQQVQASGHLRRLKVKMFKHVHEIDGQLTTPRAGNEFWQGEAFKVIVLHTYISDTMASSSTA